MSSNHDVFGKGIFTLGLTIALSALPAAVHAENNQQPGQQKAQLTDKAGNTYGLVGIEGPDSLGSNRDAPLAGVVRSANAMTGSVPDGRNRGRTIRLKPSGGKCKQSMSGTNQNNVLDGSKSACDEYMLGYGGDDALIGGAGNNTLNGGSGADVMTGGGGADSYAYERASDSTVDAADTITDFRKNNVLDLGGVARTAGVRLSYIGWNEFTGVPGQVNYNITEYWKCDRKWRCSDQYVTVVGVDLTGSGTADFCINLLGLHHPKPANFVLKQE
jgi:hypothetical protein